MYTETHMHKLRIEAPMLRACIPIEYSSVYGLWGSEEENVYEIQGGYWHAKDNNDDGFSREDYNDDF